LSKLSLLHFCSSKPLLSSCRLASNVAGQQWLVRFGWRGARRNDDTLRSSVYGCPVKRRQAVCASAIAGKNYRRGVQLPSRGVIITASSRQLLRFTAGSVLQPKLLRG